VNIREKKMTLVVLMIAALFLVIFGAAPYARSLGESREEVSSSPTNPSGAGANGVAPAQDMEPPSSIPVSPIFFDAVYVVNGGDGMNGSISVINADTNTVARTIMLTDAMWPHHIYMSADRNKLLVAVPGMDLSMGHDQEMPPDMMGAVMLLDAKTGATIKSRMLPAMNHNAVFSPNQSEVWTSQMMMDMPGSVLVLSATTLATLQEIPVGDMPAEVTFSPGGTQGWVTNMMSNTVSAINPSTKTVFKTIAVGEMPIIPSQADNGHIYVDCEMGKSISVVDRTHLHVDFTYNLGFTPAYAKLGPDGHLWVTDTDNGKVVLFDPDRDDRQHEIKVGAGAHAIDFSADGKTAYVSNQMANTVSVIDVGSRTVKKTVTVGAKPNGVLFRTHTH